MPMGPRWFRMLVSGCVLLFLLHGPSLPELLPLVGSQSAGGWCRLDDWAVGPSSHGIQSAWGQEVVIPDADFIGSGASAGVRLQRPGRWTTMAVEAENLGDTAAELKIAYYFKRNPSRQFSRRVWVPPHSRRMVLCPMLVPLEDPGGAHEVISTVTDVTSGVERLLPDPSGTLNRSSLLSGTLDRVTTATLSEPERSEDALQRNDDATRAIVAARLAGEHSRRSMEIYRWLLPDQALYLEPMDQFVISNPAPFSDVGFMNALREWLADGGSLWIMLDRVGTEEVSKLLGNVWQGTEVGRVDLTEVEFQPESPGLLKGDRREFEQPVEMRRLFVENADVLYRVEGWPAAFTMQFGRGRVVFTTVAAPAWFRPATPEDGQREDPFHRADHLAVPELLTLAGEMYRSNPRNPVVSEDWQQYLAKRIGYQIVPRPPVQWIMTLFLVALAVSIPWLRRRDEQYRLAMIAPLLAFLAALPIALLGMTTQRSIPDTVAMGQMIQVVPHQDSATVRGTVAMYRQMPGVLEASGQGSGYFLPDLADQEGTIHEMVWSDADRWEWEKVRIPAGVQTGSFSQSLPLESPCSIDATFGPDGLEGRLVGGNWKTPEDPLILSMASRGLKVTWGEDGRFRAGANDLLGPRQFVSSQILNDEQQRRQELLRATFDRRSATGFPHVPSLVFWTDPLPSPFDFSSDARQTGAALVQVPVTLRRPPPGTEVTIPSSFLPYRTTQGPGSRGVAATYRHSTGEWMGSERSSYSWIRIRVPDVLRPLSLNRLLFQLHIHAPGRQVEIAMEERGESVTLMTRNQPSGVLNLDVDRPELLELDEYGGLLVGILVGDAADVENSSAEWQIHDLQVTLKGRID